jgi:hypothetical protein
MRGTSRAHVAAALVCIVAGCAAPHHPAGSTHDPFTSAVATLMDFEFDGELYAASASNAKGLIRAQLLYTVGSLNGDNGVAQLGHLALSNITTAAAGGLYHVRYHAKLAVSWGSKTNLPSSYSFTLPRRADTPTTFTNTYGQRCNDGESDSVNSSNFWYHYRPRAADCALASADVVSFNVTTRKSPLNDSVPKYPEYHAVWEDGRLEVVAIFGKYAVGDRDDSDAGIAGFDTFVNAVRSEFPSAVTTPANLAANPGVSAPDIELHVARADGTQIDIVALLVDSVPTAGAQFLARYSQLSPGADVIMYNGHAGLGANVAYLSKQGHFFPAKYQIMFMDGCDTFAYVDNTLPSIRALLNPDDPAGTKYMDMITNSMPAYFVSMPDSTMQLIRALAQPTQPKSYDEIFANIDPAQVAVVTGEEDNVFSPGYDPGPLWNGLDASDSVGYKQTISYETELLQPGTYVFAMTASPAASGGDGDLRVRVGAPPTLTASYKCKSYVANSDEKCVVTLTAPNKVYMAATGDSSARAAFNLDAWQLPPDGL